MERLYHSAEGATALLNNIAYTTGVSGDHWLSGLQVTPNTTDTSGIYVDVANGVVNVNDTEVNIASQKVKLSAASNDPYIAVIYADSNGMGAIEGAEAARDPSGASFPNLWSPAPDDGGNVPGVARATVIVDPSVADSTDLTSGDIRNYNAQGVEAVTTDSLPTAIGNIPDSDLPLQTETKETQQFDGSYPNEYRRDSFSVTVPSPMDQVPANGFHRSAIALPPGHQLRLRRVTITDTTGSIDAGITAEVSWSVGGGPITVYNSSNQFNENADGTPLATVNGPSNGFKAVRFVLDNSADSESIPTSAAFFGEIVDNNFSP